MTTAAFQIRSVREPRPGISVIQFNEDHTFSAGADGTITTTEQNTYINRFVMYANIRNQAGVGIDTQIAYVPGQATPTTNNTYTVAAYSNSDFSNAENSFNVTGGASGSSSPNGIETFRTITRPGNNFIPAVDAWSYTTNFIVRINNINYPYSVRSYLRFAREGASQSLQVNPNGKKFRFADGDATAPLGTEGDIIIDASVIDPDNTFTGNFTWESVEVGTNGLYNDSDFTAVDSSRVSGTNNSRLTIRRQDFITDTAIVYRATRNAGTAPNLLTFEDRTTIARRDGADAQISIEPQITAGAADFTNAGVGGASQSVTYTMRLFEGGVEITNLAGWTFTYRDETRDTEIDPNSLPAYIQLSNSRGGSNDIITVDEGVAGTINTTTGIPQHGNVRISATATR